MNNNTQKKISIRPVNLVLVILLVIGTLFGQEIKERFINKDTVKFVLDSYNIENAQFIDKTVYDSKVGTLK